MSRDTENFQRQALRELISYVFDLRELQTLCFDLGIDKDQFSKPKPLLISELISFLCRRIQINLLKSYLLKNRPSTDWNAIDWNVICERSNQPMSVESIPYKGLSFYDVHDGPIYFGRERFNHNIN